MLITRLVEHARARSDLPPAFYRPRWVRWAIRLDAKGRPLTGQLDDLASSESPKGISLTVPYTYRSGQRAPATLIADTLQYVLGVPKDDTAAAVPKAASCRQNWSSLIGAWQRDTPDDPIAHAVHRFAADGAALTVPEAASAAELVAIAVDGQWAHEAPSARRYWEQVVVDRKGLKGPGGAGISGVCLVCGREGRLLETIPESVKQGLIPVTGQTKDAQLVSINKTAQGRRGDTQLVNTPICVSCAGGSMSALNTLLSDRNHRHRAGDSVLVWWLRKPLDDEPPMFRAVLEARPDDVRAVFDAVHHPSRDRAPSGVDANGFYAATLSANGPRVVVRDWIDTSLDTALSNVAYWFDDQAIADTWHGGTRQVGLGSLTLALGRWDAARKRYDPDSAPTGSERRFLLCALRNLPAPADTLPRLIRRIRADHHLDTPRASLLRLALVRRYHGHKESIMPILDDANKNTAYICGRIFAVLESIQREALGSNINTTIVDKYYGVVAERPLLTLEMLGNNARGHLKRIRHRTERKGAAAAAALENRLNDLHAMLTEEMPRHLDVYGQAWVHLGYHHQRAADRADRAAARNGHDADTTHD